MSMTDTSSHSRHEPADPQDGGRPRIIVICGPTGIGKTSTTIRLARTFGGEIVSADSMQIYRRMNIGTAKPTPEEQAAAAHHLIDVADPDEPFDAARYARMARESVRALHSRGVVPFVAGGTGLYIKALVQGIVPAPPPDPELRRRLKGEAAAFGTPYLHKRLRQRDPAAAERIHPNDGFRIIRALAVLQTTGKSLTDYHAGHRFEDAPFSVCKIGLTMDRTALYDRINRRVDLMIAEGLADEVRQLLAVGYSPGLKSMQSLGYRHMVAFFQGKQTWEEALRTLKRDTRRYAKRQMTWFGADPQINWFTPEQTAEMAALVKNFLQGGPQ